MNYIFLVVYIIQTKQKICLFVNNFVISSKGVIIILHLSTCVSPLQKLSNRSTNGIMKDIMNFTLSVNRAPKLPRVSRGNIGAIWRVGKKYRG